MGFCPPCQFKQWDIVQWAFVLVGFCPSGLLSVPPSSGSTVYSLFVKLMIVTVLLTNYVVCYLLIIYQTRVSHDLIITDNSYRSCLILIYTACGCCVHAGCHETAKGLAIISSLQNYVCVRGPVQGFGFLYFTHFRAWKAKACRHMR